jgi:hypothetical protein
MADWPDLDEVKQVLNVDLEVDNWGTTLERIRLAAIERVKMDRGEWDDTVDEPNEALAQAALRMCELLAERPEAIVQFARGSKPDDPTYWRLMQGNRRRFAIS